MSQIRPPAAERRLTLEDSRRWARFEHRADDIFISTPPKSGTTWMQGIVSSLLWPDGDFPGDRDERSPWIDLRAWPLDDMLVHVATQQHRRFIKTHSPADCVPLFVGCKYIVVYRDGRDALMSWRNHRSAMRAEFLAMMSASAEQEGLPTMMPWDGDMEVLFDEWRREHSPIRHLASWWGLRDEGFVAFVHYNDLKADLEGEMRRLAAFLGIHVADRQWPQVVSRCGLSEMREETRRTGRQHLAFEGGVDSFFHLGTNGRWKGVLSPELLERYDDLVAELPADAARWLEAGSLATEMRPGSG